MFQQKLAIALSIAALALIAACSGDQAPSVSTPEEDATFAPYQEPQTQSLMLRLDSLIIDLVTDSNQVSVFGVASPDATVSVNGRLTLPDAQGRFSIDLDRPQNENPMTIEVAATSITGEYEYQVRPVVFSDLGGVLGSVTTVTQSEITIQTDSGPVVLNLDPDTAVSIHGWESPLASNIAPGSMAAALADGPRAASILSVPVRPVRTTHFTGVIVESDSGNTSMTLRDDSGRQVTVNTADGLDAAQIGELVTAVLMQDLSTGSLTITAFDRAIAGAERLDDSLALRKDTGDSESFDNRSVLLARLIEHGIRNLSILSNGLASNGNAMAEANEVYAGLFSKHNIGAPSADVTGLVSAINTVSGDSISGEVTVQPESGPSVMARLSDATKVALFGERVKSGQLDLASRVTVRYALDGGDASRITVLAGDTLTSESSLHLALSADRGEAQGTLTKIGSRPATITILDPATGQQISLQTGGVAQVGSFSEGASVFARFNPDSYRLLELDLAVPGFGAPLIDEELVSGVVQSFIPKVVSGNLTVRTPDGQLRSFTHNAETAIRRDGLNVSINEVRVGDLVRPNTKVLSSDTPDGQAGEIVTLSLKAPEPGQVTGFIRGITTGPNGEVRVTVSNIWLELISLRVGPNTAIAEQGQTLGIEDLALGQEVRLGSYDPVTQVASHLNLNPPKVSVNARLIR